MKRNFSVSVLGLCLCVFLSVNCTGCGRWPGMNPVTETSTSVEGTENTMTYNNLPYSIRSKMSVAIKVETVKNDLGEVESVTDEPSNMYSKFTMSDKSYVFVFYTSDDRVEFIWRAKYLSSSESLLALKEGDTLKSVQEIDEYTSVYDNGDKTGISEHRCLNGDLISIKYDHTENGDWVISSVEESSDPFEFVQKITAQDKELLGTE